MFIIYVIDLPTKNKMSRQGFCRKCSSKLPQALSILYDDINKKNRDKRVNSLFCK